MNESDLYRQRIENLQNILKEKEANTLLVTDIKNIRYLSGFTGSTAMMVVSEDKSEFFTDFRYISQAQHEVRGSKLTEVGRSYLPDIMERVKEISPDTLGIETSMTLDKFNDLKELTDDNLEIKETSGIVESLRSIKDQKEVDLIKKSLKIAAGAFKETLEIVKPGIKEKDISLELEYKLKKGGGEKIAFNIIVAGGPRGALPHGVASDRPLEQNEFIVFDFGTVYSGYNSDITRTVYLGEPSEKEKKVYSTVLEAQKKALEGIVPGMKSDSADALARNHIDSEGYADNFGHGLGHGVGLNVHEGPVLSSRKDNKLKKGMVFTVEPGIYIEDEFGVRIEDIVHLKEDGCEILTDLDKELLTI